ncbi:MAG: hypothetical protein JSV88_13365 [Candidatus Aminicenantes bacterium]|nr:MAG: hypothetical protein JSV88_13365 [Candidatus Aminicenantes bacterium]
MFQQYKFRFKIKDINPPGKRGNYLPPISPLFLFSKNSNLKEFIFSISGLYAEGSTLKHFLHASRQS